MTVSTGSLSLRCAAARFAMAAAIFGNALCIVANAQSDSFGVTDATTATTPEARFEFATITGAGDVLTASRVPVTAGTSIVYKDVSLQFSVDASGNLTLAAGYPKIVSSQNPIVSSFKSGKYVGPSTILNGQASVTVNGPGIVTGGATEWALSSASGANACTYPASATWYVGPIATSPLAARLKAAGISSTAWSYGVAGSPCSIHGDTWGTNTLIGVSQVGNTVTFVSFTLYAKDAALPVDQITYTLAP